MEQITHTRKAIKIDLISWLYTERLHCSGIDESNPVDSMLRTQAQRFGKGYARVDFSAASADYLRRLEAIFGQVGWIVRQDGGEAVLEDRQLITLFNASNSRNKEYRSWDYARRLVTRAEAIDIPTLLASHLDDQFVVTPKGGIYTPIEWDELFRKMDDPIITSVLPYSSDQTHQRVADKYAEVYQCLRSKPWEPYEKSWMDN